MLIEGVTIKDGRVNTKDAGYTFEATQPEAYNLFKELYPQVFGSLQEAWIKGYLGMENRFGAPDSEYTLWWKKGKQYKKTGTKDTDWYVTEESASYVNGPYPTKETARANLRHSETAYKTKRLPDGGYVTAKGEIIATKQQLINMGYGWHWDMKDKKATKDSIMECPYCKSTFQKDHVRTRMKKWGKDKQSFYSTRHCPNCDKRILLRDDNPDIESVNTRLSKLRTYCNYCKMNGQFDDYRDAMGEILDLQKQIEDMRNGEMSTKDAKNFMGERVFQTYEAWKRACRQIDPNVKFEGDRDICQAGKVGEWDGDKGVIYNTKDSKKLMKDDVSEERLNLITSWGKYDFYYDKEINKVVAWNTYTGNYDLSVPATAKGFNKNLHLGTVENMKRKLSKDSKTKDVYSEVYKGFGLMIDDLGVIIIMGAIPIAKVKTVEEAKEKIDKIISERKINDSKKLMKDAASVALKKLDRIKKRMKDVELSSRAVWNRKDFDEMVKAGHFTIVSKQPYGYEVKTKSGELYGVEVKDSKIKDDDKSLIREYKGWKIYVSTDSGVYTVVKGAKFFNFNGGANHNDNVFKIQRIIDNQTKDAFPVGAKVKYVGKYADPALTNAKAIIVGAGDDKGVGGGNMVRIRFDNGREAIVPYMDVEHTNDSKIKDADWQVKYIASGYGTLSDWSDNKNNAIKEFNRVKFLSKEQIGEEMGLNDDLIPRISEIRLVDDKGSTVQSYRVRDSKPTAKDRMLKGLDLLKRRVKDAFGMNTEEQQKEFDTRNIEEETIKNNAFRRVVFTGNTLQLVLMSLLPNEDIGMEVHNNVDQFFRIEEGEGLLEIEGQGSQPVKDGFSILITAGTKHNVKNIGSEPLKLYTIYGPPNHPADRLQNTKAEAVKEESKKVIGDKKTKDQDKNEEQNYFYKGYDVIISKTYAINYIHKDNPRYEIAKKEPPVWQINIYKNNRNKYFENVKNVSSMSELKQYANKKVDSLIQQHPFDSKKTKDTDRIEFDKLNDLIKEGRIEVDSWIGVSGNHGTAQVRGTSGKLSSLFVENIPDWFKKKYRIGDSKTKDANALNCVNYNSTNRKCKSGGKGTDEKGWRFNIKVGDECPVVGQSKFTCSNYKVKE